MRGKSSLMQKQTHRGWSLRETRLLRASLRTSVAGPHTRFFFACLSFQLESLLFANRKESPSGKYNRNIIYHSEDETRLRLNW